MKKLPRLSAVLLVTTGLLATAPAVSLLTTGPAHSTTQRADGPTERQFPGCLTCWEYGTP